MTGSVELEIRGLGIVPPVGKTLTGERCDRCNAEGRVQLSRGDLTLVLCGHHFQRFELELTAGGWKITADSRAELLAR